MLWLRTGAKVGGHSDYHGLTVALALTVAIWAISPVSALDAADSAAPAFRVEGQVATPLALSASDIAGLPRAKVAVSDDSGAKTEYEGVAVVDILRRAGAPLGEALRGPRMTMYVVARGSDGYQVVFALAEFDPAFSNQVILLADRRDGQPLNKREGPLRIIVPEDKRHGRWVRGVVALALGNVQ